MLYNITIEITDDLTPEGIEKLKKDQILMFRKNGQRLDLKITRIKGGRVWAKRIKTYAKNDAPIGIKRP